MNMTLDILNQAMNTLMRDRPPAPITVRFVSDHLFPQEHYADAVAFIPHHWLHRAVARFLNPNAPTATVIRVGELTRPDEAGFVVNGIAFIPESLRHRFRAMGGA